MYPAKPGILIGFHGCDKKVRDAIVDQQSMLEESKKDYNWLGAGMYFWENNPERAFDFAEELRLLPQKGKDPIRKSAVLGAIIDLGLCLDLLEKEHIGLVKQSFSTLEASYTALDLKLPRNLAACNDSVRGVFIEGDPVYKTAGFYEKSHIQLCIRNPNCIKGFFKPRQEDKGWITP